MVAQPAENCLHGMRPEVVWSCWRGNDTRAYSEPVYTGSYEEK